MEDSSQKELMAAFYFTLKNNALYTVEYLIRGHALDIHFKMSTFLQRDGKEMGRRRPKFIPSRKSPTYNFNATAM